METSSLCVYNSCICANYDWVKDYLFPIILAILSAWITTRLTVKSERAKLVNEVRRNVYMNALHILNRLTKNPTLIFDDAYMDEMSNVALEIEVYASKLIQDSFASFVQDIQSRYQEYLEQFKCDEERNEYAKDPFFADTFEREEFDYTVENMPQFEDVMQVVKSLKSAIAECLREG